MAKYQLTLSPDYLADWGVSEAVRELFQNVLDNQTQEPSNEMFFSYDEQEQTLYLGNKTSVLEPKTLLMGYSTKREDDRTIGKHGEGYKVAFLVLLREGKGVRVLNYGAKEEWTTRLVKSRKFQGASVVEVETKRKIFERVPDQHLQFVVTGITPEEYQSIVLKNLHVQEEFAFLDIPYHEGRILLDPRHKGQVFIRGLYVATNDKFVYGYDFSPQMIGLDRDRRLVDTYMLAFNTSLMWSHSGATEILTTLIRGQAPDVADIKYDTGVTIQGTAKQEVKEKMKEEFISKYGVGSVPVKDDETLERVSKIEGAKPVIVKPQEYSFYETSDFVDKERLPELSAKTQLINWADTIRFSITSDKWDELQGIIKRL